MKKTKITIGKEILDIVTWVLFSASLMPVVVMLMFLWNVPEVSGVDNLVRSFFATALVLSFIPYLSVATAVLASVNLFFVRRLTQRVVLVAAILVEIAILVWYLSG